jgi:hypothetical protein
MAGSAIAPGSGDVVRSADWKHSIHHTLSHNYTHGVEMSKNWLWARDKMKSARSKTRGKPLGNNTSLVVSRSSPTQEWETDETVYACEYHGTEVVRYYPDGTVAASFQGWPTITTARRISDFAPFHLYTRNGRVMAGSRSSRWIGGDHTWFYWKKGTLIFHDGAKVPDLIQVRRKDVIPKRRDTLSEPLEGDAFQDSHGMWVVTKTFEAPGQVLKMFPYFGDHPDNRALVVTDGESRHLLSPIELLAQSQEGGLKPINRFVWSNPTGREADPACPR